MCEFKTTFTCDVCGEKIEYPHFRIEWGYNEPRKPKEKKPYEFIQVCHEDCSYGIKNDKGCPSTVGDIIFDQALQYDAKYIRDRLKELSKDNPLLKDQIKKIKKKIFK